MGQRIHLASGSSKSTKWFVFGVFLQVIILLFFKVSGLTFSASKNTFLIPVGISFYSFQILSYYSDIKNKRLLPERNVIKFALYISFFPQILAGPIERASQLIPQFDSINFKKSNVYIGAKFILVGLFRKVIVADKLALIVDPIYNNPSHFNGLILIMGTLLFSIQIYCDFSGYTNIAIGSAKFFGIELSKNFNKPYLAKSVKEFWKRWHITLSEWFRDYVYIPLGGNERTGLKRISVIFTVFGLSGIWHGFGLTFLLWGGLHALFYLVEEVIRRKITTPFRMPDFFKVITTFLLVSFLWIFFRSQSVADAYHIVSKILHIKYLILSSEEISYFNEVSGLNTYSLTIVLIILCLFFLVDFFKIDDKFTLRKISTTPTVSDFIFIDAIIVLLIFLGDWGGESFIYFQF